MLSHFSFLLLFSANIYAASPEARISNETISFLKNNIKLCSNYKNTVVFADHYIEGMVENINTNKDLKSFQFVERKLILESMFGCSDQFNKDFSKKIAEENREYHLYQRGLLKKEVAEFEKRGLTGASIINEFHSYTENNDIDLPPDPELDSLLNKKKAQFEERKKSCTDVMNLKEPLSENRPRNQKGMGWCYAYTAADLVTNILGENVSAVYAAGTFNNLLISRIRRLDEGGNITDAANAILDNGICLEKDLPSNDYAFINMQNDLGTLYKSVNELGAIYSEKKEMASMADKKPVVMKNKFSIQQVYVDLCTQQTDTLIQLSQVFPHLTLDQLTKVLMTSGTRSFNNLTQTCPAINTNKLKDIKFQTLESKNNTKKLFPKIDEVLSSGQIIGISYTAEVLLDYKSENMKDYHASTLIGRRFNDKTKSCEYLLRNSWGNDCSSYSANIECQNGHAWISEEVFKYNNAIYRVSYAEKK